MNGIPVHDTVGIHDNVGTQDTVGTHWLTGNVGTAAAFTSFVVPACLQIGGKVGKQIKV